MLHVERTCLHREVERLKEEFAGDERAEFPGPLVEVHRRVDAAGLVVVGLTLARQDCEVERPGRFGEEAKRVIVCALDAIGFDHGIRSLRAKAQRKVVARSVRFVDHRPLVQAKAIEARGGVDRRFRHEVAYIRKRLAAACPQCVEVYGDGRTARGGVDDAIVAIFRLRYIRRLAEQRRAEAGCQRVRWDGRIG